VRISDIVEATPRKHGGVASRLYEKVGRKGEAFPHCAAAKPRNATADVFLCKGILLAGFVPASHLLAQVFAQGALMREGVARTA